MREMRAKKLEGLTEVEIQELKRVEAEKRKARYWKNKQAKIQTTFIKNCRRQGLDPD